MNLLFADETSVEPSQGPFFIYGGLSVPDASARTVHRDFCKLLAANRYNPMKVPGDARPLKFTGKVPDGIGREAMKTIKREALALAAAGGCKLHVYAIRHDIAAKMQKRHWLLNHLLRCFQITLADRGEDGVVVIDHYGKGEEEKTLRQVMQERFLYGLVFPWGRTPLANVVAITEGCTGSSNFASILDVALGCVRLAVNERETEDQRQLGRLLLQQVEPLFPRHGDGTIHVLHLDFLPRRVYAPMFYGYQQLARFFAECGLPMGRLPDVR